MSADNPKLFESISWSADDHTQCVQTDITLRDLFAMAALSGIAARDLRPNTTGNSMVKWADVRGQYPPGLATEAFEIADAMLAERAKGKS